MSLANAIISVGARVRKTKKPQVFRPGAFLSVSGAPASFEPIGLVPYLWGLFYQSLVRHTRGHTRRCFLEEPTVEKNGGSRPITYLPAGSFRWVSHYESVTG